MIAYRDYKATHNNKYICDRCKTELTGDERVIIYIDHKKNSIGFRKEWDFCATCYRLLKKGVERRTNGNTSNSNI